MDFGSDRARDRTDFDRIALIAQSPATLRNAALIRDCQPGPPARKWATTSGSRRMFTASFAIGFLGRPLRRINFPASKRSARSNHSLVSSGASSGSVQVLLEASFFPFMPIPHRDDAPAAVALRPNNRDEAAEK